MGLHAGFYSSYRQQRYRTGYAVGITVDTLYGRLVNSNVRVQPATDLSKIAGAALCGLSAKFATY